MPLKRMTPEDARRDHRQMMAFLAVNAAGGGFIGLVLAGMIIWFDPGGIGSRILGSDQWLVAILLLAVPLVITFAASAAASAIWLMPYERKFAPEPRKVDDDQEDPDSKPR